MFPDIVHWGFLHVRSYGLLLAIAFLVGTWLALREARRLAIDEDKLVGVILVTLVASIFGARALYVLEHLDQFRGAWGSVLALWQGGLTLYGGMIGGAIAGLWSARRAGLSMWSVADALAPSLALGTAFGRIGCFLNGCCYGHPTSLPWGVVYPPDSFPGVEFGDTPIHPAQLYFALSGIGLFVLLWSVRKRMTVPGQLFWLFVVLFAVVRVLLDFTRAYEADAVLIHFGKSGFTESQITSVAMALFAILMLQRRERRRTPRAAATAAPPQAIEAPAEEIPPREAAPPR